ncbi:MAG: hypothetical protein ACLQM8_14350, partial [Limisphaerales bacterium]
RRLNGGPDPLSTSQIPLFVLNLVPIQQRAVFLLGSPYPVVFAMFGAEDHMVAEAGEGVSHTVRELFSLTSRRKTIKRRYATRDNSNASDRGLEVHDYSQAPLRGAKAP